MLAMRSRFTQAGWLSIFSKGKQAVETELRKNTDDRARRVMEMGAEEEDEDEE